MTEGVEGYGGGSYDGGVEGIAAEGERVGDEGEGVTPPGAQLGKVTYLKYIGSRDVGKTL